MVDGLLDLISLEGIYPCLSTDVGIPIERRVRSVLQGGVVTQPVMEAQDGGDLLAEIVDGLYPIVKEGNNGLGLALHERTLVDVVAGAGQLAFDPSESAQQRHKRYGIVFKVLLEQYVALLLIIASNSIFTSNPNESQYHAALTLNIPSESPCQRFSRP